MSFLNLNFLSIGHVKKIVKCISKHDKMWLFKSTEHHETYLTLTVGKKQFRKKSCYIPHQRETIFPLPFKT